MLFLERWPEVSLVNILDVLLVAALAYQLFRLVRGTRAAQVLVGLAVLALVAYGAHAGQLPMVDWLVSHLLPFAGIALVVLFQAEIRRGLARLGRRLTTVGRSQLEGKESYEDIVLAADLFAQNRTGALMVMERESGLRTFAESGVPLDARLSYDLLATIFGPGAPLHDGAVIVRQDRIVAAACFLPLSMNPVISRQLGTRHRAGIGITEESDAVAVIVSEENGSIALAVGGKIERDLSVEGLRQRLSELLQAYLPPTALPTSIVADEMEPARKINHE
ncbi:MAG: diadenylate cyclase CdaA [Acidobacteriota bacterium]|nr:diadenylate cyclase CdaA [Acidobacteriota bacterium]